jgi:phage-related protein
LQESQVNLQKYYDDLRTGAGAVKRSTQEVQNAIEAEWIDVESAFQSFLSAAGDQADTVRGVVSARAQAQRQSWEASLTVLRKQATEIVDKARGEFDATFKRLSDETEKFQSRIGEVKDAGDQSWNAVKSGLAEARAVHDRTIQKIKEALSKLL